MAWWEQAQVVVEVIRDCLLIAAVVFGVPIGLRRWILAERHDVREEEKHRLERETQRNERFAQARDRVLDADGNDSFRAAARVHAMHDMVRIAREDQSGTLLVHAKDVTGRFRAREGALEEKGFMPGDRNYEWVLEQAVRDGESSEDLEWLADKYYKELDGVITTRETRMAEAQARREAQRTTARENEHG